MKKFLFGIISIIILASAVGWVMYDIVIPTQIHNGADVAEKNDVKQSIVENKEDNTKKQILQNNIKWILPLYLLEKVSLNCML